MNELLPLEQKPGQKGCRYLHFQVEKGSATYRIAEIE